MSLAVRPLSLYAPDQPPRGPRLKHLLDRYCGTRPALGAQGARQYRVAVNLARRWLISLRRPTSCDELFSLDSFCAFAKWLADPCEQRQPATINGRLDVLWMLWSFASDESLCDRPLPPPRKRPRWKEPKHDPIAFTLGEVMRLLTAAGEAKPMSAVSWWSPDHWVTLIGAFVITGERFDALLHCPRSALSGDVLTVPAELTKDRKESPVVLWPWLAEKMRRLPVVGSCENPLFWPYPFGPAQLRNRYTLDILKPSGLPLTRKHKFHCLRRTAVTQVWISAGPDAARETARHFSRSLTEAKYLSRSVVRQQSNAAPGYELERPAADDPQMKLF
jgi:hypothetical protein